MDINKLTIKSQEAVQRAQQITMDYEQQIVENAHILKGIIEIDEDVTPFLLKKLGVNTERFAETLDKIVLSYPKVSGGEVQFSRAASNTLTKSFTYIKE
jgi:ATP-dependent Clp protease ATP-binding subunit ClpB